MIESRTYLARPGNVFATLIQMGILLTVILGSGLALGGCGDAGREQGVDWYLAQGLALHKQGDLDKALRMYDKALDLDPTNARAYVNRSDIYLQDRSTYDQAIAEASKAIELDPSLAEAYVNRASALVDMGHLAHSGSHHDQSTAPSPTSGEEASSQVARFQQAIVDATKAIKLDPKLAGAYFIRAHAYADTGRAKLAIADYDRVLKLSPSIYLEVITYSHRSQAHRYLGNLDESVHDATYAIELEPDLAADLKADPSVATGMRLDATLATAYTNRGQAYEEQGQIEAAIADYTTALKRDPDQVEGYANRAMAYTRVGLFQEALADADKAIALNDHLAPAYNARALAYLGLGRHEDAITDVTRAIEQDPAFAMAFSNRAFMYTGLGRYDQALADATKAIELDSNLVSAYANRAEAYLQKGEYDMAIYESTVAIRRQ